MNEWAMVLRQVWQAANPSRGTNDGNVRPTCEFEFIQILRYLMALVPTSARPDEARWLHKPKALAHLHMQMCSAKEVFVKKWKEL